eukprot:CAMPEP_0177162422 /NCGR_PEP_ID=MMETSP0367-20130122/5876_1 /TAXON_ID=447022 ORGANISM="Scrippsiella hangoei-like, Strain SHHI-4" /NCGR_SAMPLE_ID=MMETSP0367 /ASSEMBLY_ACC=CAM_ASM_000362 /LENGTH=63 /DNA_ID=CAMNT_0018608191 /DNA_START=515 /DNA_END=706 /DNA_ORIENTATION=+
MYVLEVAELEKHAQQPQVVGTIGVVPNQSDPVAELDLLPIYALEARVARRLARAPSSVAIATA